MSKSLLSGQEVVRSGTIISLYNQIAEIFPFDDDNTFSLSFHFELLTEEEDRKKSSIVVESRAEMPGAIIRARRFYRSGVHFSNAKPMNFASDEKYDYFGSFAFNIFGRIDRYTSIITYTIYRGEL